MCSRTDESICLIYDIEITVNTFIKMMNGQNLDRSLNDGIDSLKGNKSFIFGPAIKRYSDDLNDILSQKAGQYAIKYIHADTRGQPVHSEKSGQVGVTLSSNVRRKARQAQNSPIVQAQQLRRSGLFLKSYLSESYSIIHTA